MRKIYLLALFVFTASVCNLQSQDNFTNAMTEALSGLSKAQTAEDMQDISNTFDRIAQAEPTQWLAYYYASYSLLLQTFMLEDNTAKEKIYNMALTIADKADLISKNNSEILTLKAFILSMKISLDPMKYGMKLGAQANNLLNDALIANSKNPRAHLLKAENLFYTPEQFGGDKVKACESANTALDLFKTNKSDSTIDPSWGQEEVEKLVSQCSEAK